MNFDSEIGRRLVLIVHRFTPKGSSEPRFNFGVDFESFDSILYIAELQAMTPEQREEKSKREELELWDAVDPYCNRSEPRSDHATMRIYHISGEMPAGLVEGDQWEVEIVKCYLNPNDGRTKDNRRKMHFSVKPIERVAVERRAIDWTKKQLSVHSSCGHNHRDEVILLDKVDDGPFRYTDVHAGNWVVYGRAAYCKNVVVASEVHFVVTSNMWMNGENKREGGRVETKKLKARWRALSGAPQALWDQVVERELCAEYVR